MTNKVNINVNDLYKMTNKVEINIDDLHSMTKLLFEAYLVDGEDGYIQTPLKLGLIEHREVTQEDLDQDIMEDDWTFSVGDMAYFMISMNEMKQKLC